MDKRNVGRWAAAEILVCLLCSAATGARAAQQTQEESREADLGSIRALLDDGRFAAAEAAARELLTQAERLHGSESPAAADALDLMVEALRRAGKALSPDSKLLAERSVHLREAVSGARSPATATSVSNLAMVLDAEGDFGAAAALHERALAIRQEILGPDHAEVAKTLRELAQLDRVLGEYARAKRRIDRALEINTRALGEDHAETASTLGDLGNLLATMGEFAAARQAYERAIQINETALRPGHPRSADVMNSLAILLRKHGEYDAARVHFERALAIWEAALGPDHPSVVACRTNYAQLLAELGELEKAKSLYEELLVVWERLLGPEHPTLAVVLHNLGELLQTLGELERARALFERDLAITVKSVGPEHPEAAFTLVSIGEVLRDTDDLIGSRRVLEQAVAISERALGKEHLEVARALNGLANTLSHIGDLEEARVLYERCAVIAEKSLGPDNPDHATALHNLAGTLYELGEYDEARPLAERALRIREKVVGPEHVEIAMSLITLGALDLASGDYAAAKTRFERSLAIYEKALGPMSPDVAMSAGNLAGVLAETGQYELARPLFERALAIHEAIFDPQHPAISEDLRNLARLFWDNGRPGEALRTSLRAAAAVRERFTATARALSEREALLYGEKHQSGLDVALTVLAEEGPPAAESNVGAVWDEVIRSRALVLDEMVHRQRGAAATESEEIAGLLENLRAARDRLARLMIRGPAAESPQRFRQRVSEARRERERAERALGERSAAFRLALEKGVAGLSEVDGALREGGALVAYVHYLHRTRIAGGERARTPPVKDVPSYLALVQPRRGKSPAVVPLGPAEEVESRLHAWLRQAASSPGWLEGPGSRAEQKSLRAGDELRRSVWDPLAKHLRDARVVFVVPDGALHLVNLSALAGEEGRYLVETDPSIHYLSAERDLIRQAPSRDSSGGLLVLGGPDFDAAPNAASAVRVSKNSGQEKEAPRRRRSACAELRSLKFRPLPSSRSEAEEIAALWQRDEAGRSGGAETLLKLLGAEATEQEIKSRIAGRRIVHLATHGFLANDRCPSALDPLREPGGGKGKVRGGGAAGENPLLLSGLALAGANRREQAPEEVEDGILTAEEIASLDLRGVEWAVLSACETGVGPVRNGEGVLGLRRAFEMAGAGTLIMSLWSVEDAAAREWMRGLYEARLGGAATIDAVRRASVRMIEARRKARKSTHPALWGAFVAAGDWR